MSALGAINTTTDLPAWVKVTKTFSDYSTAGLTNDISIYTLPARGHIHDVRILPTTAFSGGAISAYTLSVGIAGSLAKYRAAQNVFTGFSINTATTPICGVEATGATTDIRAQATSTTANLDQATQGAVEFHLLVSILS